MTANDDLELHDDTEARFHYRVARQSWLIIGALAAVILLVVGSALLLGRGAGLFDDEIVLGIGLVVLVIGLMLLPSPILDILASMRSELMVTPERLSWRGFGGEKSFEWDEIIAIGVPPEDPNRIDDQRFHVLLEDEYEFIHGYNLRRREQVAALMKSRGEFEEEISIARYGFMCRSGNSEEVEKRARAHLVSEDDPWDFWSSRFRRR